MPVSDKLRVLILSITPSVPFMAEIAGLLLNCHLGSVRAALAWFQRKHL
jgi:hypothetical protein